jgi:hypothetical protein
MLPDGGRYTGKWENDVKHGEFVYLKGKSSKTEKWEEGKLKKCLLF